MPFKSEKQRRYLWANEPEIARDWTDTYGSRIQKNEGGITDMVTVPKHWQSAPGHPKTELAYITKKEKDLLVKKDLHNSLKDGPNVGPGGVMSLNGMYGGEYRTGEEVSAAERGNKDAFGKSEANQKAAAEARAGYIAAGGGGGKPGKGDSPEVKKQIKKIKDNRKLTLGDKYKKWTSDRRKKDLLRNMAYYAKGKPFAPPLMQMLQGGMTEEEFEEKFGVSIEGLIGLSPMEQTNIFGKEMSQFDKDRLSEMAGYYGKDYLSQSDFEKAFYGPKGPPQLGGGGDGPQPLWMQQGYPSYEAWKAAQGKGGTTVAEEVVETTSPFQQSLNTGIAQGISPYYVGANPTAANIAWGQQFGVDPRTMYMAEGGPIRQRYFLGKLVKKIGRAAKKVIKSPLGKAALIGGLGWAAHAGKLGSWGTGIFGKDKLGKFLTKEMASKTWDPWKLGILGASTLPFFMGGQEEDQDKAFDYEGAKNAYINEIMRIKRGALAGTLDPNQFVYQGIKDGGRIGYQGGGMEDPLLVEEYKKYVFEMEEMGLQPMSFEEFRAQAIAGMASGGRAGYYAGGQSIPSEYTMEDARKTAMQDKLGGITEVMKQADLYRQGDVGQMYMAQGGPTQEAGIMDLGGVEKDYRETGGFVPIGKEEKADDVPARLSLNEFVMTADAVRGMGDGDIDQGAERMEDLMETLEVKGKRKQGASDMFEVSERLSAVV
jgi:hypothetical protein